MIITKKKYSRQSKKYIRNLDKKSIYKRELCYKTMKHNSQINHKSKQKKLYNKYNKYNKHNKYEKYKKYNLKYVFNGAGVSNYVNAVHINVRLLISYPIINSGSEYINSGSDLTNAHKLGQLNNAPSIILKGIQDNQKYLVIMYDPDAPNGMKQEGNHKFVHWIFIQNGTSINERQIILQYQRPNPPKGTHRYIFNIYNANGITENDIKNLFSSGRTYNNNVITKLPNIQHDPMFFIVNTIKN